MASRKEQKEQARARRLAEERDRTERARRDRRLRMIGGVVAGVIVVVAVGIAVSSGGSSAPVGLQNGTTANRTATSVQSLLAGIPQSGARLGSPKAPVTMTYYGDLECPFCSQFSVSGGFPQLVENEVKQGKVQVVYRAFETATQDPSVFKTEHVAALAAGQQQRFWNFVELFYHQQGPEGSGYVTESYLGGLAKQVAGLNLSRWESDRNNPALANQIASDEQMGTAAGVQGTPTVLFQGPKGKASPAAAGALPTYSELQQAIKQVS